MFTETQYTPPHKEAIEGLVRSLYDVIAREIARERGLEVGVIV